jgi:hypothetical protein
VTRRSTRPGTPVAWPFRVWLGVEVLFGLAAVLSVGVSPADTATNFAWPIQPVVMASALGALYFSVAPTFVVAVVAKRWEMIRVLVVPAAIFTTAELVATLVHWDKFSVGTRPFDLWLASYALPPLVYVAAYLWHQRRAGPRTFDKPLPSLLRMGLVALGGLLTLEAIVAFVHPRYFISAFPWALTPLTTRVLCGFLLAIGTILLSMAWENDRDRVRVVCPLFVLLLPAVVFQVARYRDQVDASSVRFWTILVYLGVLFCLGVYLARGDWRETLG